MAPTCEWGIAVNSLWPRTAIATAAMQMIPGVDLALCRKSEIMADAAHGVTDLDVYAMTPGSHHFMPDFFVD